jgi:hypothetical protein
VRLANQFRTTTAPGSAKQNRGEVHIRRAPLKSAARVLKMLTIKAISLGVIALEPGRGGEP